jgi:3-deoxy-D-manno-octulosonic-acid transferase
MPVFFGPNYKKFAEAKELIAQGAAVSVSNEDQLFVQIEKLLNDNSLMQQASADARKYVQEKSGATERIRNHLNI